MKIIKFLIAILVLLAVTGSLSAREEGNGKKKAANKAAKGKKKIAKKEKKLEKLKKKHGVEENTAGVQYTKPTEAQVELMPIAEIEESSAHTNGERAHVTKPHPHVKPGKAPVYTGKVTVNHVHGKPGKAPTHKGGKVTSNSGHTGKVTSNSGHTGPAIKNTVVHVNKLPKKAPVHQGHVKKTVLNKMTEKKPKAKTVAKKGE